MNGTKSSGQIMHLHNNQEKNLRYRIEDGLMYKRDVVKVKNDKCTQTSNVDLLESIKRLVHDRFSRYRDAFIKDKYLDPCVSNLQNENRELREQAQLLRTKLEVLEEKNLKRRTSKFYTSPVDRKEYYSSQSLTPIDLNNNTLRAAKPQRVLSKQHSYQPPVQMVSPVQQQSQYAYSSQQYSRSKSFLSHDSKTAYKRHHSVPYPPKYCNAPVPADLFKQDILIKPSSDIMPYKVNTQYRAVAPNHKTQGKTRWKPSAYQARHLPYEPALPTHKPIFGLKQLQKREPEIISSFSDLPKLKASISTNGNSGIILTWDFENLIRDLDEYKIECYKLFAHQAKDTQTIPPLDVTMWKKIGIVNALPLPMACTLTQFAAGNVYFFAVQPIDIYGREGEMSNPCIIRLNFTS
ncbi:uncharacterized protein LOC130622233 [Hydractinia symbiolongicarpus]|uniref:uncharacterized protein LOC130622233 n=1 Tax=Hydractinia symbiolongicarpus TaxID=13093 RepID=UPI0025510FFD|nr:uncharacterized protein LOC130622233 [Hydractinia symbiolongicarpus]XP_057293656.1 uncharacterized protein LOC130622233 [Hydractinia symbiolongicarpus]